MDKRYQIFVSSTYMDLIEERKIIFHTVMEMDRIPAGMELFPAQDDEQWEFIKRIIDDSDYYLLIIGGRYGSLTTEGISYTEKEFDYAIETGKKVVAIVHGTPEKLAVERSETNPELIEKLSTFRKKVQTNRLVKYWDRAEELAGLIAVSLNKTFKAYPAVGWVRGDGESPTELLSELNGLRKANDNLRAQFVAKPVGNIAKMSEKVTLEANYWCNESCERVFHSINTNWDGICSKIFPLMLGTSSDGLLKDALAMWVCSVHDAAGINFHNWDIIKVQLTAYGLIECTNSEVFLTDFGKQKMFELCAIKTDHKIS